MPLLYSFPPIAAPSARVLILGSMPGEESLRQGQYYAYRHNQFWKIISEVTGVEPAAPYGQRTKALKAGGIAIWDVLKSCHRRGSLDSGIDEKTLKPNNFNAFFHKHRRIKHIFFNGGTAERYFRKYVLPSLGAYAARLSYARLPSTSPANASWTPAQKQKAWKAVARYSQSR